MPKNLPTQDDPGDSTFTEHLVIGGPGDGGPPIPIDLSFERTVCARHGEPFRINWPAGFMVFGLTVFEAFVKQPAAQDIDIQAAIDARPLCELVNTFDLMHAYQRSDIGVQGECALCGVERAGTPYNTQLGGKVKTYAHLCFECVVYHLTPLS